VIRNDDSVYGINTGFGLLANTRIPREQLAQLQRNIVLSHAAGVGPLLDDRVVRLVLSGGRTEPPRAVRLAELRQYLGISQEELLAHLEGMQERRLLRRIAAILFHRRAGFSANGMGVWKVPDEKIMEMGMQMSTFRGISHCYQRPTYADWPYSVFTMAHGRSKEECDAILDSISEATGITERSTLYSSTEFKKIRLLYFTDDYRNWERQNAGV